MQLAFISLLLKRYWTGSKNEELLPRIQEAEEGKRDIVFCWCSTLKKVEDILIKPKGFSLPVRKEMTKSDTGIKVILIDVTETPIEHPKKTEILLFGEKEAAYIKDTTCD